MQRHHCGGHGNAMRVADAVFEMRRSRDAMSAILEYADAVLGEEHALRILIREIVGGSTDRHKLYSRRTMRGVRDFYNGVWEEAYGEAECWEKNGERVSMHRCVVPSSSTVTSVFSEEVNDGVDVADGMVSVRVNFTPFTVGEERCTLDVAVRREWKDEQPFALCVSSSTTSHSKLKNFKSKKNQLAAIQRDIDSMGASSFTNIINYAAPNSVTSWNIFYTVVGRSLRTFASSHRFLVGRSLYDVSVDKQQRASVYTSGSTELGNFSEFTLSVIRLLKILYVSLAFGSDRRLPWDRIKYMGHRCALPTKTTGVYAQLFLTSALGHRMLCQVDGEWHAHRVIDWWRMFRRCSAAVNARLGVDASEFNGPFAHFMYKLELCSEPSVVPSMLAIAYDEIEDVEEEQIEDEIETEDVALVLRV